MMFSMEKRSGRSGSGTSEESEMNRGSELVKEGVPSDEVYSAVAAVSDEIGDILKDELGDADRADRIGAELADLSAELGLLAGLADGEPQQDFPSLFDIAMGHRSSASGSSSSSWSGRRQSGRSRVPPRRRPITKCKEASRRRSAMARRAAWRGRRGPPSDASDVGADSDSEDQWTELDDASGLSDTSSGKEAAAVADVGCNDYHKEPAEAPALGQFLLPLLSAGPAPPEPDHFLIRHEDILQLLASAEDSVRDELPLEDDEAALDSQPDVLSGSDMFICEEAPVTPEEEAALLHYVCEAERDGAPAEDVDKFKPVEDWLLGVYHSWCEISALMYTLIGTEMSVETVRSEWSYRASFGCHCRLCLCLANNATALHRFLRGLVWSLAHGGNTVAATGVMRALRLRAGSTSRACEWDVARLQRLRFGDDGAAIVHEQLNRLSQQSEVTEQIVNKVCLCREHERPFEKEYAIERFCKILEHFKAASTITFKVEMSASEPADEEWVDRARRRLASFLAPQQRASTSSRLRDMAARTTPHEQSAWSGYKHRCDCLNPRTLCAQQRKQLLSDVYYRISFFGMMQAVNEFNGKTQSAENKLPNDIKPESSGRELQQGDGTGAKPPDNEQTSLVKAGSDRELSDSNGDLDDLSASESLSGSVTGSGTGSASASGSGSVSESAGASGLCGAVRRLVRSIAGIERLMDRVLRHCAACPPPAHAHRKRVDLGLSEVDRKLMAIYRRLPDVHRRQLQVYRRQKKLSTVCTQLVGGCAPAPPPPGSPPPAPPHQPCRALCPEYHLQRFKEVRRKVMHMRDQQLYYHRLRMWLEDQLRLERESLPDSNVTLVEDLPRRKRRTASPKTTRLNAAPKRKIKPVTSSINKSHKILQMLKHKLPAETNDVMKDMELNVESKDETKSEAEPPEAFPLDKEENISDTETIVGEKDGEMCKDMKDCLAKFANFALNNQEEEQVKEETKFPESMSPPLQEMSPTSSEPMPVYSPKANQRLIAVNKFLQRSEVEDTVFEFQTEMTTEVLNVPLNARRTPLLVKDESDTEMNVAEVVDCEMVVNSNKEANVDRYVTFSLEVKKAMEECQNIINSYNNIKDKKDLDKMEMMDLPLSLDHIYEVMVNLEKNAEILEKIDAEDPIDLVAANAKLSELVENMPQILANMPEIASKLSELARTPFELPEFASIMSNLPDVNNEAQLTPETLKQIRELKLNKTRDNVKVTKNTAKRKTNRRIKNNFDNSEVVGTMTFELDSKELSELLKDVKDIQNLMKNKNSKEDFKDLLFSISAQVVINKVFEYVKQNKSPEIVKCLEEDRELLGKNILVPEMYTKESTLFDNSVKDALSMDDLRELIRSRFNSWKQYVANKFKSIPIDLLENELETMLDKFQSYIQELAGKQSVNDTDKIIEKIENARKGTDGGNDSDNENCAASKESLKQITKLLSPQAGNTFDLLIMKLSKMTEDQKTTVKSLKFKYMDVVRRCIESQQLINWILSDPEIAADVILDHTGLPVKKPDNVPDFSTISLDRKKDYFTERLKEMNKIFMQTLPKKALTGDEWLVMLYRLEQLEESLKETFSKIPPPVKQNPQTQCASEAEILAAKGLSKIIGKANAARNVKKMFAASQKQVKKEEKVEVPVNKETPKENDKDEKKCKNEALLAKCEAILTSKGEKNLLDSFYTIKSYITQGLPVPDTYKKHVISICSSIDAKLLDEDIEETLKLKGEEKTDDGISELSKDKTPLSVIGSQNPELLAKYSAQALRNAKQTLNAVAFRNIMRNGQTKSESDACDTPKSDCKWTNDCVCNNCKQTDVTGSVCLGDIVKQCYDMETKSKNGLEEMKKEVKQVKPVPKQAKAQAKVCENVSHQQHVCKVGHGAGNSCAGETSSDQPCSCCYCTVFGHAPPLTTPVPRNFNETRERLRSILNKKKQKCKTSNTNGEVAEPVVERKQVTVQTQTVDVPQQPKPAKPVPPQPKPATPQPKPPTLPKTLPPASTSSPVQPKRQTPDEQQRQLADKMAKMTVSEKPDNKPKATQHTVTIQTNVLTSLKTDGKVNPNAMEQIRIQQLKQQHIQQQQMQHHQQMFQQQILQQQQKKPEPIYDLPIHNKPTLTPQQQQQIRQQQLQQQQQQQQQLQQQQQQQQQHQQQQQMQQQAQLQQQRQQQQQQLLQQQQQIQQQQLQQKQQQEQQQQQQQQQLQQQQQMQQQRQGRPQQQKAAVSLSSRDTSVFSTSSGCSGGSFWRCGRAEDPRDLDALLQYIEGPQRHVDRGKKRAKKQRQRAKKMESRLLEHQSALLHEMAYARGMAASFRVTLQAATRQAQNAREALAPYRAKKKGKILKLNPAIQAKVQLLTEQLSKVNMFITTTAKEIQAAERQEAEARRRLDQCEKELEEARAIQGKQDWPDQQQNQNADEQVNANTQTQELQKTQKQHLDRQCLQNFLEQKDAVQALGGGDGTGVVRVRRAGTGGVTLSVGGRADVPLAQLLQASGLKQTGSNAHEEPAPQQKPDQPQRKQTWEQALAHINQIAKGSNKDKKKQKGTQAAKAEVKQNKEQQKSQTSAEPPTLSKKQRKLLAKQQAEEEEKKKQQEAEAKKKDKKTDPPKAEPVNKKVEKKLEVKTEEKAKKKECKKQEKAEKKGKENKQEKNVTVPAAKAKQPTNSNPPQSNKKEKKKEQQQQQKQDQQKPQVINITADTTIEVVNKKSPCPTENEKPASCSIMEQLSSGVQVADLKLPPGITLTRVQPSEKKEAPPLKSVPLWRCSALAAPPTPAPRPPPVITADPAASMFTTTQPEAPKTVIVPEPPPPQPAPTGKSKKAKKKAKKAAAAAAESENKQDGAKMVTLRNPMFHPNLPSVQITNAPQKKAEIRIPDPIPMPPTACQATITPTSNGMYTIRNPLMSMMHQQSLMGLRTPTPVTPMNTMFTQPQYTYVNPNVYNPVQTAPTQAYVLDPSRNSPKNQESDFQNRIMNLASFTQKSEDGYSLFNTPDDNQQRSFLTPEYYEETPKPVVSPNPIGTRPNVERNFENESLFANPIQRPEPIGTPLRREETNDFTGSLYTPFGQEDRNVFRNALFNDKADTGPNLCKAQDVGFSPMANGDSLPYFQRLRVGSKLNNEVTIHHVTESKFYKGQEGPQSLDAQRGDESLFSRPSPPVWPDSMYTNCHNHNTVNASSASSPAAGSVLGSPAPTPSAESPGAVGERAYHAHHESSVFLPDNSITNLSALEAAEREIESFKRFDFYFEPPRHKPRVQLDVNALRPAHK